jgi:transposase
MLTRPDLLQLSVAEKDTLITALFDQLDALVQTIQVMQARIDALEGRLGKDSHNSHKPPSSDGFGKKPPKSLRDPSGRKPGGQQGHGGSTLKFTKHPDVIVEHPLQLRCDQCGQGLQTQGLTPIRRQVFDLVKPVVQVTEHRGYETHCTCGKHHSSRFPVEAAAPVQYGPVIKGTLVYLTQQQLLPMARTAQLVQDLYGVKLSTGTVQASIGQAAQQLIVSYEQIAQAIRVMPVVHFDETGQRAEARLRWLHVASTAELTWYFTHDKRGQLAMDDAQILPRFRGVAVHDGWASYRDYDCTHALCNAHHLRELIYLEETTQQPWTRKMIDFLRAAKKETDEATSEGLPIGPRRLGNLRRAYDAILSEGEKDNPLSCIRKRARGRVKQTPAVNLLKRLRQHSDDVLRFLGDLTVPFDNNQAERDIRMPKLKQKTSGCFRTVAGADAFAVIRSYVATLRKQGRNVFEALTGVFRDQIADPVTA